MYNGIRFIFFDDHILRFLGCILCLWCLLLAPVSSQDTTQVQEEEEDPLLGLPEPITPPPEPKKKHVPRNVFFGLRTKRKIIRTSGTYRIKEIFYYLRPKTKEEIPVYVPYVYWYDKSNKRIMYTSREAPRNGPLLHGSYQKKWKKTLLEERYFFHGTPHSRWRWLNAKNVLLDKRYYFKGWTADAKKNYYDVAQTKLREVIPIQYTERNGPYYAFHKNGQMAVKGLYRFEKRVQQWKEFYSNGQIKRIIQYPEEAFLEERPYILKDWNEEGKLLYEKKGSRKKRKRGRKSR